MFNIIFTDQHKKQQQSVGDVIIIFLCDFKFVDCVYNLTGYVG
jgi:hypothetical protein